MMNNRGGNSMHQYMRSALFLLTLTFCFFSTSLSAQEKITLPLNIILVTDMPMTKRGQHMQTWTSPQDINSILPEINRIWAPANIAFKIENVHKLKSLRPPQWQQKISGIVAAKRNAHGKSDPNRLALLHELVDFSAHRDDQINIYVIPYLGERSQGNASRKKNRIFVGTWTDKPFRDETPPMRVALVEPEPLKQGSLARTIAHELGHILGLKHPNKKKQKEFGLLMGGKRPGYALTQAEIDQARRVAKKRLL